MISPASILFLLSFAIFSVSEASLSTSCCGSLNVSSFPDAQVNFTLDTPLELNEGWQPFYFGPAGSWAMASNTSGAFYTNYPVASIIRITDAFKTGDRFSLYLNGSFLGNSTLSNPNSTFYTPYPNEAWIHSNYSHGEWLIPAGLHRFTIKVLDSVVPEGSGAFIRADMNPEIECGNCRPLCSGGPCKCFPVADPQNPPGCCANNPPKVFPICKEASGRFTMIKGPFTRDQGIEACAQMDLRLAEIDISNFDGVNQFAYVCNGNQVAQSWIRSWNGDIYQNACLVLSSGSFGGSGAINVQPCESKEFVLCEA